ncbi:MAG: alpha/beta hydrolase [Chloroflexi bacterium]|nr:MAG: alpha/beta hydrolase [Chloroflexota bacterium]
MRFVAIHSLAVGPTTWEPVRAVLLERGHKVDLPNLTATAVSPLPTALRVARRVAEAVDAKPGERIVILAHSNAGLFAPAIGDALGHSRISYVFVDASVPPPSGTTGVVPEEFLSGLRAKAEHGLLPPWTEWWDPSDVAALFPPVAGLREAITREQPRLPLSWCEQTVEVPAGWDRSPCGYIYFGPPYDGIADELVDRGWPVRHVPGLHLHMVVDPVAVADTIEEVVFALG